MNVTDKSNIVGLATYNDEAGDYSVFSIKAIAISVDGNYLYTSSAGGHVVSMMNVTNKSEIVPLATHWDDSGSYSVQGIESLAISNDGNYLYTSSYSDDYVSIMNVTDKNSIVPLATYFDDEGAFSVEGVRAIAISVDGN
ncbi:unnamed protein product, partial [marine sediment metagenome]